MKAQNKTIAGLYCRLSRDDKDGGLKSMSIKNQRQMLQDYAAEKRWEVYDVYEDDGFTGTNFDRPAFKRMLKDAKAGRLNCIITKDLSRLGRNVGECTRYMEEVFPDYGVRYIAIADGVDTNEENDMTSFLHVFNEIYPKQVSRKVKQVKGGCAKKGMFMGSQAPYGYKKSPEDKHILIPDEEAASIVQRIFYEFASGDSGRMIADRLSLEGYDTPRFYHYKKAGKVNPLSNEKNAWGSGTVMALLRNQAYIGIMAQGKREVINFKTKKRRMVDPEEWKVVEGTHEPIINRELWDQAHAMLDNGVKVKKTKKGTVGLFSGRILCAECKSPLALTPRERKDGVKYAYRCSRFNNNGGHACTTHNIDQDFLSSIVLNDMRLYARLTVAERKHLKKQLLQEMNTQRTVESRKLLAELTKVGNRLSDIAVLIKNLYEDKCQGKYPEQVVINLMDGYAKEQRELEELQKQLSLAVQSAKDAEEEISEWMDLIERCLDIEVLDRETVKELIDRVEVSESRDANGKRRLEVSIYYRFVGNLLGLNKEDIA